MNPLTFWTSLYSQREQRICSPMGHTPVFRAWFCFWREICFPLKWRKKVYLIFYFFLNAVRWSHTVEHSLSQETFKNPFKQTSDSPRELPCMHNSLSLSHGALQSGGSGGTPLLCLKLTVALLSEQPSYWTCMHVLFIKKVLINIPDKKQAYK